MSKFFAETNGENALLLFNKRKIYRNMILRQDNPNVVQMDVAEKIFYGRLDSTFVPITLSRNNLKQITSTNETATLLRATNFVVDLFEQMATQFKKCAQIGKLRTVPFLTNLKAHKAYQDPFELYDTYRQQYYNSLGGAAIKENIKFKTFDEMISLFMPILRQSVKSQPFTYTGFMKSKNCSVMSSGLAIEIADSDYINDSDKYNEFVKSPNWDFYVKTCSSYGFMIDLNVPWRIIVDLDSSAAIQAASEYTSTTSAFETIAKMYVNSSQYNYSFFKKTLFDMYNNIKREYVESKVCSDGTVQLVEITPDNFTFEQFLEKYDENYFIELYIKLRIYEEAPDVSNELCDRIVKNQLSYFKSSNNLNMLFKFLESQLNKTFDKSGSLSYLVDGDLKRTRDDFADGTVTNVTITEGGNDFSGY